MRESLKMYLSLFGPWLYVFIVSEAASVIGISEQLGVTKHVPLWLWWAVLYGGLLVGPFLVFHKYRLATERKIADRDKEISTLKEVVDYATSPKWPTLTDDEWDVLGLCAPSPTKTQWLETLDDPRINDQVAKNDAGGVYVGQYLLDLMRVLERKGVVTILSDQEIRCSFQVTDLGCEMHRKGRGEHG